MEANDEKFIKNWKGKRQHKWRYIYRFGVLGWGLPVGLIAYFLMIVVGTRDFDISGLFIQILVYSGGGMAFGEFQFQVSDKRYLKLLQPNRQQFHERF